jgi:hypothetical protein
LKCVSCGAENNTDQKFCSTCGQPLLSPLSSAQATYQYPQMGGPQPGIANIGGYRFFSRLFAGISWLFVSIGTFLVGIGYLGVIDSAYSYTGSSQTSFNIVGYGIFAYALAAIFVALNRFVKDH